MASTDSLHELIHALSKSEKRYFKVSVSRTASLQRQKYVKLFDLLGDMELFDKDRVQASMGWKNFRASYSMAKRHLQDKILQVLASYQSENSSEKKLKTYLSQINVLMDKQLHQQAKKKILQAKRFASKIEDNIRLLETLKLERHLMIRHRKSLFDPEDLIALNAEINRTVSAIDLEEKTLQIHYHFFAPINFRGALSKESSGTQNDSVIEELKQLQALSSPHFLAKVYHYNALNLFHYLNRDFASSLSAMTAIDQLFLGQVVMQKVHQRKYMANLANLGSRCLVLEEYAQALETIRSLRQIKAQNHQLETQRMESYLVLAMAMVRNSGEFGKNKSVLAMAIMAIRDPNQRFSSRFLINIQWHIASWYFCIGNFTETLRWITEILNMHDVSKVLYYDRLIPAVEMLVQYELGNHDLLEYRIRNRLENVKSQAIFDFENLFFLYLRNMVRASSRTDIAETSQQFLEDLRKIQNAPSETAVFTFFEFAEWAESKIRGETIIEVVQRNWFENIGIPVLME